MSSNPRKDAIQEYILGDVERAIKATLSAYELFTIIKQIDDIAERIDNFDWPEDYWSDLYDDEEECEDIEDIDLEDKIREYCKILSRKLCQAVDWTLMPDGFMYGFDTITSLQDDFKVSANLYNVLAPKEEELLEKINELMLRLDKQYSSDYRTYF